LRQGGYVLPTTLYEEIRMMRIAIRLGILCCVLTLLAQFAFSQQIANVTGKWNVTIRMPDKNVTEQWTITQDKSGNVAATIKTPGGEQKVTGEVNNVLLRFDYKIGEMEHKIRATVDKDEMDGSVTMGKKEYVWSAKRAK
jgi:hypothetical protein